MKPFARINLSSVLSSVALAKGDALRRGILVSSLALAAVGEARPARPDCECYSYVCGQCGKVTRYKDIDNSLGSCLEKWRSECLELRELGVDVVFDESGLCRNCKPADALKIPHYASLVRCDGNWHQGDKVEVVCTLKRRWCVVPRDNMYWVRRSDISDDGTITATIARIRLHPDMNDATEGFAFVAEHMNVISAQGDWVGVEWHKASGHFLSSDSLGDVEYGEGEYASQDRFDCLAWIINGRRYNDYSDLMILLAYMKGKKILDLGDIKLPIEQYLPRIHELLGNEQDDTPTERSNR